MTLMNTSNQSTLYDSLADIFTTTREVVEHAVLRHMFEILRLGSAEEVDLNRIRKTIAKIANTEIKIEHFDFVTISHLTTRSDSSIEKPEPLYNLHESLLNETELSLRLKESGITFKKLKNKIDTYLNDELVNWESLLINSNEEPCIRMIMRRLQPNRFFTEADKCINGFLFGGDIWEHSDVRHIALMPEFAENVLRALGKRKAINEWRANVKPYVFTLQVPVSKIIFDGSDKLNKRQTQFRLLRHAFFYLCRSKQQEWKQWDNPIIRLDDNFNINSDQILSVVPVN